MIELENNLTVKSKEDLYEYFAVHSDKYIENLFNFYENYVQNIFQKKESQEKEIINFKHIVLKKNQEAKNKAESYFNILKK